MQLLQILCVIFIILDIFDNRVLAIYNPGMYILRILMCIVVVQCLKNDLEAIKVQKLFNQAIHHKQYSRENCCGSIFRMGSKHARVWVNFVSELVLIGYIMSADSDLEEGPIDIVANFTALLILVQIDEIVIGSFFRTWVPVSCLEDPFPPEEFKNFEHYLFKEFIKTKLGQNFNIITKDDFEKGKTVD